MNTSSLKSFDPAVRTQLMEAVGRKLDYVLTADTPDLRQAAAQLAFLRREAEKNRAALRLLDAQGWHPEIRTLLILLILLDPLPPETVEPTPVIPWFLQSPEN